MNKRYIKKTFFIVIILFVCMFLFNFIYRTINPNTLHKTQNTISIVKQNDYRSKDIQKILNEEKVNGVVIATSYSTNQPEVISNTLSNINLDMKVSPEKYFPIASLQKGITAYAIYQLIQENKLGLNTRLNKFFPKIYNSENITIKQLLCHQSGIYDKYPLPTNSLDSEIQRSNFTLNNIHIKTNHDWNYASTNYGMLALIIRKLTGENYFTYLDNKVLAPYDLINIKPFSKVSLNNETLPLKVDGSKLSKVMNVLDYCSSNLKIDTSSLESKLLQKKAYRYLSASFGAGDLLATPREYWNFFNKVLLKNKNYFRKINNISKSTQKGYFGGYYFNDRYIYAQGLTGKYQCCFVKADYKSDKVIMLFTNNLQFKKFKTVENRLCKIYFQNKN